MGIIKDAMTEVVKDIATDVGLSAAEGALDVAEKGVEAGGKATGFISKKISDIKDNRNMSELKKQAKKEDYCLFVDKEDELGEGIYKITTKKKEEKYNTLLNHHANEGFLLRIYNEHKGEVASVQKNVLMKSGLFSSKAVGASYVIKVGEDVLGEVYESKEGRQKVYVNSFNDWIATGEFDKGNYKIFSRSSGKTIATIAKKYAKASAYVIFCEYDRNEPIIVAMTLMIDVIH